MKKPTIVEKFADNGEHSHWELINSETSETLWIEDNRDPLKPIEEFIKEQISLFPKEINGTVKYHYDKNFDMRMIVVSPAELRIVPVVVEWESKCWDTYFENYSDIDFLVMLPLP
jgi:hypothetical protein